MPEVGFHDGGGVPYFRGRNPEPNIYQMPIAFSHTVGFRTSLGFRGLGNTPDNGNNAIFTIRSQFWDFGMELSRDGQELADARHRAAIGTPLRLSCYSC